MLVSGMLLLTRREGHLAVVTLRLCRRYVTGRRCTLSAHDRNSLIRYIVSMHQLYDSRRSLVLSTGIGAKPPGFRPLRALMTQCNVLTHHTWNAEQIMEKWWNSQPKRESSQRLYFQEKSISGSSTNLPRPTFDTLQTLLFR